MHASPIARSAHGPTSRQRSSRCRFSHLSLESAVRSAVDVFFRFQYRDPGAKALWCGTQRVWLGRETFLHWALRDADIDIPWIVAAASDAPQGEDDLRVAVRAELTAYWAERTASLPRAAQPRWLPLP